MRLKNLLQEHNQILIKQDLVLLSVVDYLNKETGLVLKKQDFLIKDNILYIKTKPIYKEKILIQKENLLVRLKDFSIFNII